MHYEPLTKIFYKNNALYDHVYLKRFESESTYQYDFMIGKNKAFVVINLEILNLISNILRLDKQLLKAAKSVPKIALIQFTQRCIVDEVKLTNEIEGVYSTRKEIREIMNDKVDNRKAKRLYGLVKKYMMLLDKQKIELKSCQDIRKLYDEFIFTEIKEDDPENLPDGEIFRKASVEVVSATQKVLHKGVYPESKIISAMTAALDSLNDDEMEYIIQIAVFHYMFGYIHPFYDGNGRMTRFISSYLLAQRLESIVAFGLSYTIKDNIKKYYDMFKEGNDHKNRGDLTPFVIGFLEFIEETIENLRSTLEGKAEKLNFYTEKIRKYVDGNIQLGRILYVLIQNSLFADEGISIQEISDNVELSSSTVRAWIKKIPEDMLIVQQSGKMKIYDVNLDVLAEF